MLYKLFLLEILSFFLQIQIIQAWNPIRSNKANDLTAKYPHTNYEGDLIAGKRSEEVELLLTQMQKRASISLSESQAPTSSNPSCFYLALSSLPSNSPCETLSRSDMSRIETAASMALCEIKTGLGSIPRECQDWQGGKPGIKVSVCVEALARSPQSWSSYSGYLREVVTICSSYRRWADLETAKQLHSDSAIKFSDFVDSLRKFEIARQEREISEAFTKDSILLHLTSLSNELGGFSNELVSQQLQRSKEVTLLHQSLLTSLHKFNSSLTSSVDRELGAVSTSIVQQQSDLRDLVEKSLSGLTSQLQTNLSNVGLDVALRLKDSLDSFQPSLRFVFDSLDQLQLGIEKNSGLVDETNKVLENAVSSSTNVVETLSNSLVVAKELLAVQAATLEAHRIQVSNLTERIEVLTQSQAEYSLVKFVRRLSLSKLLGLSSLTGFRGFVYSIISYLIGINNPWLAHLTIIVATLTSLYPALTLAFRTIILCQRFWRSSRSIRFITPTPQSPPLQIEYYRTYDLSKISPSVELKQVEGLRGKRGSRIPSNFWMDED